MPTGKPYQDPALPVAERVADLLGRMTLSEKVYQICAASAVTWITEPPELVLMKEGKFDPVRAKELIAKGISGISEVLRPMGPAEGAALAADLQRHALERTRLGIPIFIIDEALHGLASYGSTSFPQSIGLVGAFDEDLFGRIGDIIGREARARGVNQLLAPDLDLSRDPRWGRTEECVGEDPHLAARYGVAWITAVQGSPPGGRLRVAATLKHFAAHNAPEGGLNIAPTMVCERDLHDRLLPPFRAAVCEAGAAAVMAAYSERDGVPASADRKMLTDLLRREWGFDGMVVSDYGSVIMLHTRHKVAKDKADAAVQAVHAGVDMELPSIDCYRELIALVEAGRFPLAEIDEAVRRVLRVKFRLGLFENPYPDAKAVGKVSNCPQHRAVALEAARKSIVLLQNRDNLLPLAKKAKRIAVIGPNADRVAIGNYGTSGIEVVTAAAGLRAKLGKDRVTCTPGCHLYRDGDEGFAEAVRLAREADAAVLVLGENSDWGTEEPKPICGEGIDSDSLELAGRQLALAEAVLAAQPRTICVLYNGRPLAMRWLRERMPAIIEAWYPGCEGGTALAEILLGEVNPSGRLAITLPDHVGQLPVYYNHKPSARGFDSKPGKPGEPGRDYIFASPAPAFRFGHGLSYTTFAYRDLRVSSPSVGPEGTLTVSVELTNSGPRAGEEVVQLYVRDLVGSTTRPVLELKAFQRVALAPKKSQRVEFSLRIADLAFTSRDGVRRVEAGDFEVLVGGNSVDLQKAPFAVT